MSLDQSISDQINKINLKNGHEFTTAIQAITFKFVRENQKPLIELLYQKGATQEEIGKVLGISRFAVSMQYPKESKINQTGEK